MEIVREFLFHYFERQQSNWKTSKYSAHHAHTHTHRHSIWYITPSTYGAPKIIYTNSYYNKLRGKHCVAVG